MAVWGKDSGLRWRLWMIQMASPILAWQSMKNKRTYLDKAEDAEVKGA
jgi:hypothetical protein